MKLRIRGDSLRLRLTRGEVEALADSGEVRETIHFGPSALDYVLRSAAIAAPRASFVDAGDDREAHVRVEVRDNGPGIEAIHRPRVFD